MLANEVYSLLLVVAFLIGFLMLIRHRRSFTRWLINDKKEVADRRKMLRRDIEDAEDELKAIDAEEAEELGK